MPRHKLKLTIPIMPFMGVKPKFRQSHPSRPTKRVLGRNKYVKKAILIAAYNQSGQNFAKVDSITGKLPAWAIYEQKWRTSDNAAYELVRIRPGSGLLAGRELYPSSERCGTDGFTLTDKDTAFKKLRQMSPAEPAKPTGTGRRRTGTGTNTN
jgi:hypothetical protein